MQITRGVVKKALRIVVYGPEGIGKTTFASQFPGAVFIDTENSTEFLDVARYPKPSSWTMLLEEVEDARRQAGAIQTLIIDTADWAEMLCKKHVCDSRNIKSIEDPGYGKGYVYLAEEWGKLLNALTEVQGAGINVVLTAHAMMRKFEQPDELGAYDRWELKLEKKTAPMTKEWADMILFANYETYVVKENKNAKGKAQGGKRVMFTSHHPCWDAKNRQGLPDKLPFAFEQIAHLLSESVTYNAVPAAAPSSMEALEPVAASGPAQTVPPSVSESGTPAPDADLPFYDSAENAGEAPESQETIPKALQDLMTERSITEAEVRSVIAEKGYYPGDTAWAVMERDGFVDGWIIPFWANITQLIESKRTH